MSEQGFFKTATFGGFDKKSVLNYIDDLNENFRIMEEELQNKILTCEEENQNLLTRIDQMNDQIQTLEDRVELEKSNAVQLADALAKMKLENERLAREIEEKDRELQIQMERGRQLQFKAESLDYKSKKYDDMTAQIGDVMLEAKQTAENIIAAANVKSEEITKQARLSLKGLHEQINRFKGELGLLKKEAGEINRILNERFDAMGKLIDEAEVIFFTEETEETAPDRPDEPKPASNFDFFQASRR